MNHTTRRLLAAMSTALFAVTLAACGSSDNGAATSTPSGKATPSDLTMDQLYQAAKSAGETKVVVYGIDPTTCYDQFSAKFPGIKVESVYMVGTLQAKLEQEHVSGEQVADVVRTGDTTLLGLAKDGILESFIPSSAATGVPSEYIDPSGQYIRVTQRASGLIYNNTKLSAADAPKKWSDLANPEYKGHVAMPDPTGPGAGLSTLEELLIHGAPTDKAWLQKFAANDPALMKDLPTTEQAVTSGEYWIGLGGLDQVSGIAAEKADPSITFKFPMEDSTPVTGHYMGILQGAPHPNAAKLLETYLLSKEGQTCLVNKGNEYGVRTDGIPNPAGMPSIQSLNGASAFRPVDQKELDLQLQYENEFKQAFKGQ
jgi:iron(III) transport system substrate-binding protein